MTFQQFQEEFKKLKLYYPARPSNIIGCENSDYGNYLYRCKNAYFCFDCAECENSTYLFDSFKSKNCVDGDYVVQSENCYDCFDIVSVSNSAYILGSDRIYDCFYCWDCYDSHDLFGCVHLKHKQFCIFNRQYSEEEYKKKKAELLKNDPEENLTEMKKIAMRFPVTNTRNFGSTNSNYGNHVNNSKSLYMCFDCHAGENCGYMYDTHYCKNSYDMTQCSHNEFSYECSDSARLNNCYYMEFCADVYDSAFCYSCTKSNHLFGCIALENKEHCILNKQYSEEEYEKNIKEIMSSYEK